MKKGLVYKIYLEKDILTAIYIGPGFTDYYGDITHNIIDNLGTVRTIADRYITKVTSTKIKPEVRALFVNLYKSYVKRTELSNQIRKLEESRNKIANGMQALSTKLKAEQNIYEPSDVYNGVNNFSSIYDADERFVITLNLEVNKQRYVNPDVSDYVYREYDDVISIKEGYDNENLFKVVSRDEIKNSLKGLEHLKLKKLGTDADIGDKNTLYESITLEFEFEKSVKLNDVRNELQFVDTWINNRANNLYHNVNR